MSVTPGIPNGFFESKEEEEAALQEQRQPQNVEERRRIRESYRPVRDELTERKQELINPADEQNLLSQKVLRVDQLFQPVKNPREGAVDSGCLVTISELGKQKAESLKTDFISFIPSTFCDEVRVLVGGNYVSQNRQRDLSSDSWAQLGKAIQPFFKKTPVLRFMCGSFEKGEITLKRARQTREKEKDDTSIQSKKPTQLSSFQETDKGELTTAQVEHLLDTLWKLYDETEQPICFFEFVTNPHSFGETVENIFYASFLVRDGHARIYLDSDSLPVIAPIQKDEMGDSRQTVHNEQVVLTITPEEWEDIVETFEIEEPLIPPNKTSQAQKENNRPSSMADETGTYCKGKGKGKKSS